jgi:sugar lactone lactonase YvrE
VTNRHLYRVRRADLDATDLSAAELADRVETWAAKTMSDGITSDLSGGIYLSNPDQSAIMRLTARGELETLVRDPRLRWPDGFSFGPDGWLYVTCSALHHVILKSAAHVRSQAPYQIFRLQPGLAAPAGH